MDIKLTTGERLQDLMKNSGTTQRELSKKLNISAGKMNDIINDSEKDIGYKVFIEIAKYFNVSTDYLLGLTDVKSTDTDIKSVCKFTGLSEEAAHRLHNISFLDFEKVSKSNDCFSPLVCCPEFVMFVDSLICDSLLFSNFTSFAFEKSAITQKDDVIVQIYKTLLEYNFDEKLCKMAFNNFNELDEQIHSICDEVTKAYQAKFSFNTDVEYIAEQFELSYEIIEYKIHKMITDFLKTKYLDDELNYLESLKQYKTKWLNKYYDILEKYGDNND